MDEPKRKRDTFLGMPMNWDRKNAFKLKKLWDPNSDELFPPKSFGIGWSVNFHAVLRAFGLIKKK